MENKGMYPETKTWNPFVGCLYDCVYCEKSFKRQLKRVGLNIKCDLCFHYRPHIHYERLKRIPSSPNIFVVGTGDIYFCPSEMVKDIFYAIQNHRPRINKTYFFQSKDPKYFDDPFYQWFFKKHQDKIILLTTLETNRDKGYDHVSRAPKPSKRFKDFYHLDYPRKVVTIEPVLDFDIDILFEMLLALKNQGSLEYVWFGYDSKNHGLNEPSIYKSQVLVDLLKRHGIEVRGKYLRGVIVE